MCRSKAFEKVYQIENAYRDAAKCAKMDVLWYQVNPLVMCPLCIYVTVHLVHVLILKFNKKSNFEYLPHITIGIEIH